MDNIYKDICEKYAKDRDFSGACMVKIGAQTLFSGAYGYANRAFYIPNRIDTKFDVASVTKVFTAAAVLYLVERGQLGLNDKITEIIDLRGTEIPSDVEIWHLLSHTSGIADDADEESGEDYAALFIDQPNYAFRKCGDMLKNFVHKKPNFKAGADIRYNNVAFVLLGLAIEKITGMDCRDFMVQSIVKPCGMKNTEFLAMEDINENTAEGYCAQYDHEGNRVGWKKNIYQYPPIGTPDGGIYTTADDLNAFIKAMTQNKLLSKEYSGMLLSPQCRFSRQYRRNIGIEARIRYGFAFEFVEIADEIFSIYKDGCNSGVAAMFSYYPKAGITISILANQDCNVWEMHREMQTEVYDTYYNSK